MADTGPLHEAIARAIHDTFGEGVEAWDALDADAKDYFRESAVAVLRVVGTQLHAAIERVPQYEVAGGRALEGFAGATRPRPATEYRADVLAVVDALLERPDAH